MEVITIESSTFNAIIHAIEENKKLTERIFQKLEAAKEDKWLSPLEAAEYSGFSKQWINSKAADIGAFKNGTALRFKRSAVDAYMQKHSFKK